MDPKAFLLQKFNARARERVCPCLYFLGAICQFAVHGSPGYHHSPIRGENYLNGKRTGSVTNSPYDLKLVYAQSNENDFSNLDHLLLWCLLIFGNAALLTIQAKVYLYSVFRIWQIDAALEEGVEALTQVVSKGLTESARCFNKEQKYKHLRLQTMPV